MTVDLFEVGGCVRDELLGLSTKDIDYTAVVSDHYGDPFAHLREYLVWNGYEIFTENPEFFTIRAHFPKSLIWHGGRDVSKLTADFVLAREEGVYTDGRRPDMVKAGDLLSDLKRRDFTVNAMARGLSGELIDPFNGAQDLANGVLRAVGSAEDRLREDALRALRALRFAVTKGFVLDAELWVAMASDWLPELVAKVAVDRRRTELLRAFKHNTMETLFCLNQLPQKLREAIFSDGLWLEPTLKG